MAYEKLEPDVGVADDNVVVEYVCKGVLKEIVTLFYFLKSELLYLLVG